MKELAPSPAITAQGSASEVKAEAPAASRSRASMAEAMPPAAAAAASAVPPRAASQLLVELNVRSARCGMWDVCVYRPRIEEWKNPKNGAPGAAFRCILVSLTDPSSYLAAQVGMRAADMKPLKKAEVTFQNNIRFNISKVVLLTDSKQQFLHCPVKLVVDLGRTHADPLLAGTCGVSNLQAQPSMTLSQVHRLSQSQRFDVTALVAGVDDTPREVSSGRKVISVRLLDESGSGGKAQEVTFSFFYDHPLGAADRATIDTLRETSGAALSFFALMGKGTDSGFSIESSKDFFVVKAVGERAARLDAAAAALRGTTHEERECLPVFSGAGGGDASYALQAGTESFCKIINGLASMTDIKELESGASIWQINWVEVAWPVDESVVTKDGSRLFFKTTLRDLSGSTSEVWMSEGPALVLAQLSTKEEFLEAHALGKSLFPPMASVKVVRKVQKTEDISDASQLAGGGWRISMVVVHAADQLLSQAPTQATLGLLPFMDHLKDDTSSILPAALHMVQASPHYAFQVVHKEDDDASDTVMPCQKILSLIRSTQSSKAESLSAGWKLTTAGIEDLLAGVGAHHASAKQYTISAICSMERLTSYRLDPPRGGAQHALVTLSAMINDTFVVDQVQLLAAEEAEKVMYSLKMLLRLASRMHSPTRKRGAPWSDAFSPAEAKKCRVLGRSPTEGPLDEA